MIKCNHREAEIDVTPCANTGTEEAADEAAFLVAMAREFAKAFYATQVWRDTREAYKKSKGGLCERCLRKGLIRPAEMVHHKVYITEENINDPRVVLNWDNLEALCNECHLQEHRGIEKRFTVDEFGRVRVIE